MIGRIDAWIGKRIMHPPIIWVCQRAKVSQYAVYRYAWWIVALHWLWLSRDAGLGHRTFLILFALMQTVNAGLAPDRPVRSALAFRVMLAFLIALGVFLGDSVAEVLNTALALVAEYAATIATIPPRKLPERRTGRKTAQVPA